MKLSKKAQTALDQMVAKFQSGDLSPIVEIARIRLDPNAPAPWTAIARIYQMSSPSK